jgi:hypothetical protein
MSTNKRKARGVCYLDIKDLLKFDSSLHYFSVCPACKELVSEHKDADFQRDQLAKMSAEGDDDMDDDSREGGRDGDGSSAPKKRAKILSAVEAASLVQQVITCTLLQ